MGRLMACRGRSSYLSSAPGPAMAVTASLNDAEGSILDMARERSPCECSGAASSTCTDPDAISRTGFMNGFYAVP